ncbi:MULTISPECIES: restriction endonuclease subunit S [Micromonospora]|uniref:Restriction endonuclease subunit S n=1 Tax=Micromonospora solifontis TaxID=2487138 RepID=A0ABX9WLM2_9ACTN|nr:MULTISPECIES: restriction endonuclease subunit S [Micromonospora]NES14585.1 restriction endonuclease subunit S [Micromonospora sp. PPF5-17B]NES35277.1 restriction endonuclease subunit S [Micromonospora solifontis]RNM01005.1 restriction endonuclease subunit S [Micromonospora solifontis]
MSEWRQTTVGELLTLEYGKPLPENARDGQGFPVYGSNGIVGYHSRAMVKGPGVIVGRKGTGSSGTVTFSEGDFSPIDTAFYVLIKDSAQIGMEFAYHLLVNAKLTELATQTGVPGLTRSRAYEIRVALPPVPLQERIVEIIGAVDDQITALEAEADSLLRVRNAALGHVLTRGGEGWSSAPLSNAGTLTRGRRFVKSDYVQSGLGCIHYGQIYTDYGASATHTVTYLPESFRDSMRLAQPGDVVIAGTSENVEDVGKAVAWLGDDDVAVHDDCFIFHHDLDPKFVSYFFASPLFQHQKRRFTSETKVVRISAANLNKIVMPVPPRDEQERISGMADAMDVQVAALRAEAARLRQARVALLSGLLDRTIDIESAERKV